jgi:hypothetical protein
METCVCAEGLFGVLASPLILFFCQNNCTVGNKTDENDPWWGHIRVWQTTDTLFQCKKLYNAGWSDAWI